MPDMSIVYIVISCVQNVLFSEKRGLILRVATSENLRTRLLYKQPVYKQREKRQRELKTVKNCILILKIAMNRLIICM